MKLKFNILWFEDTKSWIKGKLSDVKEIIEGEYFEWIEPKICKNKKEFKGEFNDYDIILMDYALTEGKNDKTGGDIIEEIRGKNVYTNILFYSKHGVDELRNKIAEKRLDGVFCADREDFVDEFESLFKSIIRKTLDINNLRGLVMAETADIDSIKEEIIELYDSTDCQKKEGIRKKTLDKMIESIKKKLKFVEGKYEEVSFKNLLDLFDLSNKSRIVHRINHRGSPICKYTHDGFDKCVIQKRNLLAHVKEKTRGTGTSKEIVLESKRGKLVFNQKEAKNIRKDITEYKKELQKIKDSLTKC